MNETLPKTKLKESQARIEAKTKKEESKLDEQLALFGIAQVIECFLDDWSIKGDRINHKHGWVELSARFRVSQGDSIKPLFFDILGHALKETKKSFTTMLENDRTPDALGYAMLEPELIRELEDDHRLTVARPLSKKDCEHARAWLEFKKNPNSAKARNGHAMRCVQPDFLIPTPSKPAGVKADSEDAPAENQLEHGESKNYSEIFSQVKGLFDSHFTQVAAKFAASVVTEDERPGPVERRFSRFTSIHNVAAEVILRTLGVDYEDEAESETRIKLVETASSSLQALVAFDKGYFFGGATEAKQ